MSTEGYIIGGIFSIILALLAWLLYRAQHEATALKTAAEAKKQTADARLTEIEAEQKRIELPSEDEREAKKTTFKQDYIRSLVAAHNEQTAQFTQLIADFGELKEKFAEMATKLQDSESLRRYFEGQTKENEKLLLDAVRKLETCAQEREQFKQQAAKVEGHERRIALLEQQNIALKTMLQENGIPFEDI